ncbi:MULTISPECIES: class I SAM-dependent methyltransferase [unclassified Aliiroseovarius]|uniref:class I SAM-dependent methyltransferase n=1 Tax=unclassified Aliiroseovarius TaxID=2623558 RepID=UPI0015699A58|nr:MULTISPECIES: class I SAM-dependent methyltransferase [unclassified Aliiroseovarius]
MTGQNDNGWGSSAKAWIADMGNQGDHGRGHVLDEPMLARVKQAAPRDMVDIGCGEGRFCRMMPALGVTPTGIDPTPELISHARTCEPEGRYVEARAEDLPFADASFDLAVFYLSLIDIPDIRAAIREATRILKPGGRILVANLAAFLTAARHDGWARAETGAQVHITGYLKEKVYWTQWRGIRIRNWHRPPRDYMQAFLDEGLRLTHYDEPASSHPDPEIKARYDEAAYFVIMEWQKPDPEY